MLAFDFDADLCHDLDAHTHTHSILAVIFPGEPGLAGCPLILLLVTIWMQEILMKLLPLTDSDIVTILHKTLINNDYHA